MFKSNDSLTGVDLPDPKPETLQGLLAGCGLHPPGLHRGLDGQLDQVSDKSQPGAFGHKPSCGQPQVGARGQVWIL